MDCAGEELSRRSIEPTGLCRATEWLASALLCCARARLISRYDDSGTRAKSLDPLLPRHSMEQLCTETKSALPSPDVKVVPAATGRRCTPGTLVQCRHGMNGSRIHFQLHQAALHRSSLLLPLPRRRFDNLVHPQNHLRSLRGRQQHRLLDLEGFEDAQLLHVAHAAGDDIHPGAG